MSKILVIDDSFFQRKVVSDIVSELGHEVIPIASSTEGLNAILTQNPDVVIMDLLMPDMNGTEVLEKLLETKNRSPVIILSADIQKSIKKKCLDLGAVAFLNKPAKKQELHEKINEILAR